VCISYDIPEIEIHGKKKLSRKGKLGGEEPVAGKAPSDRSLTSAARGIPISYVPIRDETRSKCDGNDVPGTLLWNEERVPKYLGRYHWNENN
jgi:hypothetical protein